VIRIAKVMDAEAISSLLNTAIGGTGSNDPECITKTMERETSLCFVATDCDQVVGVIVGQIVVDEAEIHDVAVNHAFRRQGRATRLVRELERHATSLGACTSFLEVRASNTAAERLYESMGYTATGTRTGYYSDGENAIVMSKTLEPQ